MHGLNLEWMQKFGNAVAKPLGGGETTRHCTGNQQVDGGVELRRVSVPFCHEISINGFNKRPKRFTVACHSPFHPETAVPTTQGNNQHVRSS